MACILCIIKIGRSGFLIMTSYRFRQGHISAIDYNKYIASGSMITNCFVMLALCVCLIRCWILINQKKTENI